MDTYRVSAVLYFLTPLRRLTACGAIYFLHNNNHMEASSVGIEFLQLDTIKFSRAARRGAYKVGTYLALL